MKKLLLLMSIVCFCSCSTIFTSSRQHITFTGEEGSKIYDPATNVKIAEIKEDHTTNISLRKSLNDKQLVIKKEGKEPQAVILESKFNNTTLWNLLFWPGFIIDLATGQMNKYDNTVINLND